MPLARCRPETLEAALAGLPKGHVGPPAVLSITNATEYGTVYSAEETAALGAIAKANGMAVHIDGARFANAVAATGASPADLSWRAGVDIMSFGGTKNGCVAADAIVVFAPEKFPDLEVLRQRVGHGMSKARFFAAQFEGYFADGGWLKTAAHANAMAARLQAGLRKSNAVRLDWESAANELFPVMSNATADKAPGGGRDVPHLGGAARRRATRAARHQLVDDRGRGRRVSRCTLAASNLTRRSACTSVNFIKGCDARQWGRGLR